jgi:hypothetical protein
VFCCGGGGDELPYAMEGFDHHADRIQLKAMTENIHHLVSSGTHGRQPTISHLEPAIDYQSARWEEFHAEQPYDYVCLTRSPAYTPTTADPLYDAIATKFVEPICLSQ